MKKITLLLLMLVPFLGMSQTWNFTNINDGWTNLNTDAAVQADYWELTSKVGVNNPGLKITGPNVNIDSVHILAITMKNKSVSGPEIIRAVATTSGTSASGTIGISFPISRGDTEYKTYYIDFRVSSGWVGTVDKIKLFFKNEDNANFIGTGKEIFHIDKIEMLSSISVTR